MVTASTARAADSSPSQDWRFSLMPYVWAVGQKGDTGVRNTVAGDAIATIDVGFSDILANLDQGALLSFEFGRGRWAGLFDGIYMNVKDSESLVKGPAAGSVSLESTQTVFMAGLAYSMFQSQRQRVELVPGLRYADMSTDITYRGSGPVGLNGKANAGDSWIEPSIGARDTWRFGPRWNLKAYGDLGGFGIGSDLSWQAAVIVGYRFPKVVGLSAGFRYLDVRYDKNDFLFDVASSGFLFGANFNW